MSVGNKYIGSVRLEARSIITQAGKGKRGAGPTFPPPRTLPQRPKSSRKESDNE